jgi:hypothetical protein
MAFPAIFDFNYYKGDTFEFRIYPKKNDGTVFDLSQYKVPTNFANDPDFLTTSASTYDSAQFTIATARGVISTDPAIQQPIRCFARVSDDNTHVLCAIRPSDAATLLAGTEYVYDVEVRKPSGTPGSGTYELVHTLVTGTITVTVVEILSNGNLVVAGEKQVAVSNEEEIIRFGGVVNPNTLVFNQVSSQQVADARIEYRGRGATDDTQGTGWFTRLMLKLAPF